MKYAASALLMVLMVLGLSADSPGEETPASQPTQQRKMSIAEQVRVFGNWAEGNPSVKEPPGNVKFFPDSFYEELAKLPGDDPGVIQAVSLARRFANPDERVEVNDLWHLDARSNARVDFAWKVLINLKLLREGQTLPEVLAIMGKPTYSGQQSHAPNEPKKDVVTRYGWVDAASKEALRCDLSVRIRGGVVTSIHRSTWGRSNDGKNSK